MSGVYYFDCQIDNGKQLEHSSTDPENPCPICRIAALEKVAEAANHWCNEELQPSETWLDCLLAIKYALRAAGYPKEVGDD